ncbi:MAG: xanthine dehydrogenase FAD-binding subunit XdhB, partial [Treponema sp.]|nr:xanthine dehydrogenase FAD-binding subunit XdhB [Treponema sp.]
MYDIEELYEAESPAHAVELLCKHPEAKIIAGGSDVLIKIREGKLAGCTLISIQKIDELRGVSINSDGAIRIGPLTSFSHIASDPLVLTHIPVLAEAAQTVGGPQIRNIATIGGNICNGVTSADSASTLLAFDAVLEYLGPKGLRQVPITEHYVSAGKTALAHEEILQAILIPKASYENCYGHYIKYAMRNALDIATLGCSANVKLGGPSDSTVTVASTWPTPFCSSSSTRSPVRVPSSGGIRDRGSGIGVHSSKSSDASVLYPNNPNKDPQSPVPDPQSLSSPRSPIPDPQSLYIDRLRLAFGVAGPVPLRALGAEQLAAGKPANAETVADIAKAALGGIKPRTSWRA